MRTPNCLPFALLTAALFAFGANATAAVPYTAVVARTKADLFSGPGGQYYRTGVLTEGTAVEVHRTVGGYLGIRPPEGSFSWAPGEDIVEDEAGLDPGVGIVDRDGVPCRVGSLLTEERNVVHVRLKQGERVRVLSRMTLDGVEWAQITPPAGEFRWVRAADMQSESVFTPITPAEPPLVVQAEPTRQIANVNASTANNSSGWVAAAAHHQPTTPAPTASAQPLGEAPPFKPQAPATATATPPAPAIPQQTVVATADPAATTPPPSTAAPAPLPPMQGPFGQQLTRLEIELSRRIAAPAETWRLEDLGAASERLLASTNDLSQAAAARSLVDRVAKFAQFSARSQQLSRVAPPVALTKAAPSTSVALSPAPGVTPVSEVIGELREVVSKTNRPGAPKFAVVDEQGKVITFLTPEPTMDLTPLVGKRVSARGVRGYMPAIRSAHLTASRVAQTAPAATTR